MNFTKMHGLGNDYVYINGFIEKYPNWPYLAKKISQPHFGVGCDGMVLILPSDRADFKMRVFKSDGSEGEISGNGLRCAAKYVYENNLTTKTHLFFETFVGKKELFLREESGQITLVQVNMGMPETEPSVCLVLPDEREVFGQVVTTGNPHFVIPVSHVFDYPVERMGKIIERHPHFMQRPSIEFVEILDRGHIRMRIWERGVGETYASGTGACAAAMSGIDQGFLDETVDVELLGGHLQVSYDSFYRLVLMAGPAETVFTGKFSKAFLEY